MTEREPDIAVVVATRNRCVLLEETLDALMSQRWPTDHYEIVVADNGSTDATAETVRRAAARPHGCPIRHVFVAEPGKSHALNAALRVTRCELLAFTDDDVKPDPGWLAAIADAFGDPAVQFVAGRTFPIWKIATPAWMSPALSGALAISDGGPLRLPIRRGVNE